jgi:hypothetical protein
MGSTGVGGRGASTIVTMINDRAEWEKCEKRERGRARVKMLELDHT